MDAKKIIEAKQERATLTTSIRALMTEFEAKEMPGDKKEEIAKMEAKFDGLSAQILSEEKQLDRERVTGEELPKSKKPDGKIEEVQASFRDYIVTGSSESFKVYAALQQDNPTQAGYLVAPEQFVSEMIKDITNAVFIRQKAKVLPPLRGAQSLGYPTRTSAMTGGAWGTEISAAPEVTSSAYGKREFKPNPHTALDKISKTLIRNYPNSDALVRGDFAEYYAGVMETAYMTGNGAGHPLGLFTASADGISTSRDVSTGNTATEIKFDGLIEAQYSVKQAYQPRCEWIFHRDAVKQIRKLKDSNGQYIWQPSVQMGQPDMLLSKPVNMSEYAPNTLTAGLYVGMYGDLQYYWIVDSLAMEIQALFELYATTNQVGYIGRIETDGQPVMETAFARVKLGA